MRKLKLVYIIFLLCFNYIEAQNFIELKVRSKKSKGYDLLYFEIKNTSSDTIYSSDKRGWSLNTKEIQWRSKRKDLIPIVKDRLINALRGKRERDSLENIGKALYNPESDSHTCTEFYYKLPPKETIKFVAEYSIHTTMRYILRFYNPKIKEGIKITLVVLANEFVKLGGEMECFYVENIEFTTLGYE